MIGLRPRLLSLGLRALPALGAREALALRLGARMLGLGRRGLGGRGCGAGPRARRLLRRSSAAAPRLERSRPRLPPRPAPRRQAPRPRLLGGRLLGRRLLRRGLLGRLPRPRAPRRQAPPRQAPRRGLLGRRLLGRRLLGGSRRGSSATGSSATGPRRRASSAATGSSAGLLGGRVGLVLARRSRRPGSPRPESPRFSLGPSRQPFLLVSFAGSRSFRIVRMRAISRFASRGARSSRARRSPTGSGG